MISGRGVGNALTSTMNDAPSVPSYCVQRVQVAVRGPHTAPVAEPAAIAALGPL